MNTCPAVASNFRRGLAAAVAAALFAAALSAQIPATGTIEGRVVNTRTGEYLELARVTVIGTTLETFTDSSGQYRLSNVPA
ncbi:MAG: carboxypeptidase-like regulatory domain-containing protein, partial [Opitutaceae bacterium]|nr:carboxypeptidase-like regulatory domain-containing protein [Opitutaceae bacterium]